MEEERDGGAQVGEEKVEGELVVAGEPVTSQGAQVEHEEAQSYHHALSHLQYLTRGSYCALFSFIKTRRIG
jgi:hypothetical protein